MNCLFLSGDYKFQVSPKVLILLPMARNAKFQPMYPLLEGVTVGWFRHSNKVLMNGRSKCLSGLVFPPSKEWFQFRKQKEITWGKVWGIQGVRQNSYFFFLQKRRDYCGGMSGGIVMQKTDMFKTSGRASFLILLFQFLQYYVFVVLSGDAFAFFHDTFIATLSPEKKIAYKTFFALKERLAIIGRLLCSVAQILLLTFLTCSK